MIRQGRVKLNGTVIENFNHPVNLETDYISIDDKIIELKHDPTVYLMLNKPRGILSTTVDSMGRKTVLDILPVKYGAMNLHPVGRLDKDTTGILLITNDGEFTYRLTHPRFEHQKEYLVYINNRLKPHEIDKLKHGIALEDGMTYPAAVRAINNMPPFDYSITIHEGKKRQIRRMFEALGHTVLALKRVRIAHLDLGDLKEGHIRKLTPEEVALF